MDNLKDKILTINKRTDIDTTQKTRLISELMKSKYSNNKKKDIK